MKHTVRYFVSYAHDDRKLAGKLAEELKRQFGASKDYEFVRWQDTDILVGEQWHAQIQNAIVQCDFGLLFVSPAFLSSNYIGRHELPHFVGAAKPAFPVALHRIDFANHDLKGLEDTQLFRYRSEGADKPRAFADYSSKLQSDFALNLFTEIKGRLDKLEAVNDGNSALKTSIPHNLPTLQPFFGREDELKRIADALDPENRGWGALIDGAGGMGKTSLAIRAAHDAPPQDFKKIAFVSLKTRELDDDGVRDLSGFLISGLSELLNELGRELGYAEIAKASEDQRPRLLLDALRGARTLLILDNLESLTKSERDRLFTFVKKLPQGCKAILTARGRIGSGAEELILEKLGEDAALATLAELSTRNPHVARTSEAERIALYNQTGGKPLLLRWTAGQLGRGHCLTFTDALQFLRSCPEGNDPLEFIFADLVDDFTPEETRALSALTYFTLPAKIEHIAELAQCDVQEADRALRSLSVRSLAVPNNESKTYTLVPLVADFLRKKRPEIIAETGDRLEKSAYALAVENGFDNYDRYPLIDAAWPTVAAALPRFISGPNDELQTICRALGNFLNFTGRWDEWLVLSRDAEGRAVAAKDFMNASWRAYEAGYIYCLRGQSAEVLACAERAEAHSREAHASFPETGFVMHLRVLAFELVKDYPSAINTCRELAELYRAARREKQLAGSLSDLAIIERDAGDLDAAERDSLEALKIARTIGEDETIAICAANLAAVALAREDWSGAEAAIREALPLSERVGRQEQIANNYQRLAVALARQDRKEEALPYARRAVEISSRLGLPNLNAARQTLAESER
jgi:tetratricopeptide (TPR) repeat protein